MNRVARESKEGHKAITPPSGMEAPTSPPHERNPCGSLILNVNDDDANRYAVSRTLRRAGLNVKEAATGGEALSLLGEQPDLVILDVDLPDISGFDVCRRMKADPTWRSIPVLQLSAKFVRTEDKVQGLEGGADGYLIQPFDPAELVATVSSLLRLRQAERKAENAAQQWQATFEAISDGVCLTDREGRILRWNQAFARLLGQALAQAVGMPFLDLLHTWSGLPRDSFSSSERRNAGPEFRIGERWFVVTTHSVLSAEEVSVGAVHLLADITDRKRAEAAETAARRDQERIQQLEQEIEILERLSALPQAGPFAIPAISLAQSSPDLFAELAHSYGEIMELALEQRQYKVSHKLSERVAALSERLSVLRAGPRDVIELYNEVLVVKRQKASQARVQAYLEEGRLLLLELMGGLVAQYRRQASEGAGPGSGRAVSKDVEEAPHD